MRRAMRLVGYGVLVLALVGAALFFLHYVPFAAASFAAWAGVMIAALGLFSLVKPLKFLRVTGRRRALLVLLSGVVLAVAGVFWPAPVVVSSAPHQRIDDFLPEFQFAEYHEGWVRAPLPLVVEAVRKVSFADMPAAVFLMRLRGLAGGQAGGPPPDPRPILDLMAQPGTGFLPLDISNPGEIVYGMVGRPWTNEAPPAVRTPEQFLAFTQPGQIRVAFNIRVMGAGGGLVHMSTETRILGNDPEAQRIFARYWRIIYPGSAIIRRVWLDAIISRSER